MTTSPEIVLPPLPKPRAHAFSMEYSGPIFTADDMNTRWLAGYEAGRASVADRGVQAVPGEPVAYPTLWPAARDVLSERRRQVSEEGWTQKHDDEHGDGSMAKAAACYALHTEPAGNVGDYLRFWPWASDWWKPKDHRRNLVRAAALILAEIERLDRDADRKSRHAAAAPWLG